jgi:hypothetical protein
MTLSPIIDSGWFNVCATINISLLRLYEEEKVLIEAKYRHFPIIPFHGGFLKVKGKVDGFTEL